MATTVLNQGGLSWFRDYQVDFEGICGELVVQGYRVLVRCEIPGTYVTSMHNIQLRDGDFFTMDIDGEPEEFMFSDVMEEAYG